MKFNVGDRVTYDMDCGMWGHPTDPLFDVRSNRVGTVTLVYAGENRIQVTWDDKGGKGKPSAKKGRYIPNSLKPLDPLLKIEVN